MKNNMLKKNIVFVTIILFVGASVVSGINNDVELVDVIDEIGNLNLGTETFYPSDDAYTSMHSPSVNTGSHWAMDIRNRYDGMSNDWEKDLLIMFDISSISSGTLIESAILKIYYHDFEQSNPAGRALTSHRITSNWGEESVTWNARPSHATGITSSSAVPGSPGQWMEWHVTGDEQDFVNGLETNYGWQIMDEAYWG
ncbi:MAG: DNRLRE domain-containing protein, partial [Thermoplasmatales archaeon]